MNSDPLDAFIGEILDKKKEMLGNISAHERSQLLSDLKERLLNQINRALVDALPDKQITEFNTLLDDESLSDVRMREFISQSGVDVEGTTLQAMLRFSESYLGRPDPNTKAASVDISPSTVAGRWLKTVNGRQFIIELREDHTLLEALKEAPNDTWSGTWSHCVTAVKGQEPSGFSVSLKIGGYLTMLRELDYEHFSGIERNDDTNSNTVPPDGRETSVELRRIRAKLR